MHEAACVKGWEKEKQGWIEIFLGCFAQTRRRFREGLRNRFYGAACSRQVATAEATFFQVLLVVFFGPVEFTGSGHFRNNGLVMLPTLLKIRS